MSDTLHAALKIAALHTEIAALESKIGAMREERDSLMGKIEHAEEIMGRLRVSLADALLASLSPSPAASPASPYTDTTTANPRHTLRVWANGKRELIDPAGDAILAYPWRSGAAIVARLHDALSKPMTRPQVEAWAAANKINVGTAVGYLPMLVNLGIVASDGLTWRALTPS